MSSRYFPFLLADNLFQAYIQANNNINLPNYINGYNDSNGNYCPLRILQNNTISQSKFLKWAQIFYGITFSLMSLALLHFYDVHRLVPNFVTQIS